MGELVFVVPVIFQHRIEENVYVCLIQLCFQIKIMFRNMDNSFITATGADIKTTTEELQACSSEPCFNSGTCIDLPEVTFTCICEPQYTGDVCQYNVPIPDLVRYIETPSFDGRSYIRLKPLKAYHKLNIDVQLKTFSENGIILYDQQNADGSGDFVSLAIVNGHVEFRHVVYSMRKIYFYICVMYM